MKKRYAWVFVAVGLLVVAPTIEYQLSGAAAVKRDVSAHKETPQKSKYEQADDDPRSHRPSDSTAFGTRRVFGDRHRAILSDYYSDAFRAGHCPTGLEKQQNSCKAPSYTRQWEVGQQIPEGVVEYDVPRTLVVQFGQLPTGYRYARVGSEILAITLGTGMVVDATRELGGK
jgi:hypothetical protein